MKKYPRPYYYRVYPDRDHKYPYLVMFCEGQEPFDAARDGVSGLDMEHGVAAAYFTGRPTNYKPKKGKCYGCLVFNIKNLKGAVGMSTIAHECIHAALHYMKYKRKLRALVYSKDQDMTEFTGEGYDKIVGRYPEERLCYAVQDMVAAIVWALRDCRKRIRKRKKR